MPMHPDEKIHPGKRQDRRHRGSDINPNSDVDVNRLRDAMRWSSKKLNPFQQRHVAAVNSFAGSRYGDNISKLDKTAATSTMHKKTAARKKSRLAKKVNALKSKKA